MNVGFHIFLFLLFQIIANLFFKWGSSAPHLYWWGYVLGNAVGMSSIIFMMGMYRALPIALVVAVGTGGTFILNQIIMAVIFRERVSFMGIVGIIMIFLGVLTVAFFNDRGEKSQSKKDLNQEMILQLPEEKPEKQK